MGCFLGDAKGTPISSGRMTLLWSPESIHDLLALRAHINEHDPAAAKRVALHILYCVEYLLAENPKLGATGRVPGTRELVIPKTPYIVPYRVSEYVEHYHAERNHQGKSNVLLFRRVMETRREEPVQCRERLGGLLRYYHCLLYTSPSPRD